MDVESAIDFYTARTFINLPNEKETYHTLPFSLDLYNEKTQKSTFGVSFFNGLALHILLMVQE